MPRTLLRTPGSLCPFYQGYFKLAFQASPLLYKLLGGSEELLLAHRHDTCRVALEDVPEVRVKSELVVGAIGDFAAVVHNLLDIVQDDTILLVAGDAALVDVVFLATRGKGNKGHLIPFFDMEDVD